MSTAKNQHYVPQWYLRRWADARGQLSVLLKPSRQFIRTSVRNVASETGFYDLSHGLSIEQELAWLDERFELGVRHILERAEQATAAGKSCRHMPISEGPRELVSAHLAMQMARTRQFRDYLIRAGEAEPLSAYMELMSHPRLADLAASFLGYEWSVWLREGGAPLFTSDTPVIPVDPLDDGPASALPVFASVLYPLSPSCLLEFSRRDGKPTPGSGNVAVRRVAVSETYAANTYQAHVSQRFVLSSTAEALSEMIASFGAEPVAQQDR